MARAGLDADAVVAAAGELVDAQGLDALTLTALATRLGVRPPSLYAHVDGLADLRARLASRGARLLGDALVRAAAGRSGTSALRAVAGAYRDFALAHPGLYAATQRIAPGGDGAPAVELMVAVVDGYRLVGADALHGVRTVRAALHGFIDLEQTGGFGMDLDPEESWTRMLAVLDRGLASGG